MTDGTLYASMKYDGVARCVDLPDGTYVKMPADMWTYASDTIRILFKDSDGAELGNTMLKLYDGKIDIFLCSNNLTVPQRRLFRELIDRGTDICCRLTDVEIRDASSGYPEIISAAVDYVYIQYPTIARINKILADRKQASEVGKASMQELAMLADAEAQ